MENRQSIGPGSNVRYWPHLSARAFLAVAAIAMLALAALLAAASVQAQDQSEKPIWSADMLVVEYTSVSIGAASSDLFSNVGGTADLKIKSLWSHIPSRDLRLKFEEGVADAEEMTLIVGDLTLEFPEWSSGERSFKWTGVDVDWEDGQTISVRIVPTSAVGTPQPNTPATGTPTISGTPQVDQMLTADTSGITDEDGLANVSYGYQWIRSDGGADTGIQDATSSTYTLGTADQGKTIKVQVSFTDEQGNEESLTSAATATVEAGPNTPATGAPTISETAHVDQTLTADTLGISDANGLTNVSYSYEWIRSEGNDDTNIQDATGSSYTLVTADQGKTIKVKVSFTDDAGNDETLTSAPVGPVQAGQSAPGAPIRLTSRWNVPGEDEGVVLEWRAPPGTVTGYQILRTVAPVSAAFAAGEPLPHGCTVEAVVHVDDTGSDATTYTDTDVLEGAYYVYRVKAINSDGVGPQSHSTALQYKPHGWWPSGGPGTPAPMGNLVSTRVNDGVELTWAAVTTLGREPTGYQILRRLPEQCEFGYRVYVKNTNSTDTSWIDTDLEFGTLYEYHVRGINDVGPGKLGSSYAIIRPARLEAGDQTNNPATGAPTITGTAQVGETLTADSSGIDDDDGLTGARFFYQWLSGQDTEIAGATSATYTPVSTDEGETIKVRVNFTDDALYQEALTSAVTVEVAAGSESTEVEVTPSDDDSAPDAPIRLWSRWNVRGEPDSIVLHWRAPPGPVTGCQILRSEDPTLNMGTWGHGCTTQMVVHVNDTGNDATTYMDTDVAEGVRYTYHVKAINLNGVGPQSNFTGLQYRPHGWWPSGGAGTPLNPRNLEGMQVNDGTELQGIELTWDAPEDFGTEVTGYQILRRLPEQCEYGYRVYVEDTGSTDTSWTDTDVEIGTLYEYHVRAINDVGPGFLARSNSASVRPIETIIMIVIGHSRLVNTPGSSDELTIAVNHLKKDDDPDTVDYTLRGDVTLDMDGSDADGCEGDGLGEDLEITVVDEVAEQFQATFGGQGCMAGTYTLTFALTDRDGQQVDSFGFGFEVEELPEEAVSLPTISGTAQAGQILTADTSDITDDDGLTNVSYSFQWIRNDGTTDTDIQDATASTYTPSVSEVGKTIKVRVSFTDDANNQESLTSAATAEVAATVPTEPLSLTVTRGSQIEELDASWQAPSSNGGSAITGYKVQWKEAAGSWDTEADVSEATVTGTTYTITGLTGGVEYAVRVIATNDVGDGAASAEATGSPVGGASQQNTEPENTEPTGLPTISGTAQAGQILTADTTGINDEDGLTDVAYSYQWIQNDGNADADIQDATASTYTPSVSDVGKTIKVRVSFADDRNNQESLTSAATSAVAATVPTQPLRLSVSRGDQAGELDASWQAPSSNGGSVVTGYKVQWKEDANSWGTSDDVSQATATGTTYTITGLTVGEEYTVRVLASNGVGDGPASVETPATRAGDTPEQSADEDTTSPTISSIAITSDPDDSEYQHLYDDGVYVIGDSIKVTVTFSEDVTVTGTPGLELDVGGAARAAEYESAGGNKVVFGYTVVEGDSDTDGVAIGENKLTLSGGSIKDASDNDANLAHSALSVQSDAKVDGIRPTITGTASITSSSGERDGVYTSEEVLSPSVSFSEEVIAFGSHSTFFIHHGFIPHDEVFMPRMQLDVGGTTRYALFNYAIPACNSGLCLFSPGPWSIRGTHLQFRYTVVKGDMDLDGVSIPANAVSLNGGAIRDAAGNDAVLTHSAVAANSRTVVDAVPATISSIEITSDPGSDNTYGVGDSIEFTVTFSEPVKYYGSLDEDGFQRPRLELNIGGVVRVAKTQERSNTKRKSVVLSYTVLAGDNDSDGVSIAANSFTLNGGSIADHNGGNFGGEVADISHGALADDPGHKVDTSSYLPKSNDATLSALTLSGVDFGTFASSTTSYTAANVAYEVSQTTVSATVNHPGASYVAKLNRVMYSDGTVSLLAGTRNDIVIVVTAEDGTTTKTYTVRVTRARSATELWTDASLSSLSLSGVDFGTFDPNTTSYTASVIHSVTQTTVDATVNYPGATYEVRAIGSGYNRYYNGTVWLLVGNNDITVRVTAEDRTTSRTYTVSVTRVEEESTDASLSSLTLSGIDLGTFASSTTSYTANVANSVIQTTVTPNVNHAGASYVIKHGGVAVFNGAVALSVGSNVITVEVTSEDDSATQTYTVTVTRAAPDSTDVVEAQSNSPATGSPTITGTAQVGQILTADTTGIDDDDGLINFSFSYQSYSHQWIGNDGGADTDIQDATASTYTVSDTDVGKTIKVRVSFTDDANNQESLTSAATAEVAATVPSEPLSLTVTRGSQIEELDASWQVPSSNGGSAITGYKVQWKEAAGSWDTEADASEETVTGTTYTITGLTGGVEYTVRVLATNDVGDGAASAEATGTPAGDTMQQNSEPTGLPTISGTAQAGQILTANTTGIDDDDGLTNVSYSYQWIRSDGNTDSDIQDATSSTYTLSDDDVGMAIKVRVNFTDNADNQETLTSAATDSVAARPNNPATGAPTISGTAQVDETLTADTTGIDDDDGLTNVSYSYQWLADDAEIEDATSSTYAVSDDDVGRTIKVRVSFADDANNQETLTSAATAAVAALPNSPATGAPTISGTALVDETLTADTSGIDDEDGLTNVSYSYQWLADDAEIEDATGSTYTVSDDDVGKTIKVRVSFADDANNQETLTSAATAAVAALPNSPATGAPTISGTALVDETLTADTSGIDDEDGLTNVSYSYHWLADDAEIQDATGSTYTVSDDDVGRTIKVRVSFTDDRGNSETLTSAATGPVEEAPQLPLTASTHGVSQSHDGENVFTFELRFSEELKPDFSFKTLRDHAFTVTGGEIKRAKRLEQGSNLRFTIHVQPDGNGGVTIVLPVTTDCDAEHAICTEDGRPLSNRLELTVSGPGG